jgi:enhancer of polycomb-like protein
MVRLKAELGQSHNLALAILQREQSKRNQTNNTLLLWRARCKALELKRKIGWCITKEEEDSLVDKERPAKKPKTSEST